MTAGVWRSRDSRSRSSSPWRCLKPYSRQDDRRRVDDHHAGVAVDDDPVVLAHQLAGLRAPTTAGMSMLRATIAVCEVCAADVGDEAGEHALLELQHVGRREVVRDQHQRHVLVVQQQVLRVLRRAGAAATPCEPRPSCAQQALDHLLEVGLALAQVLVLHLVELARQHLELRRQRPFGVVVALA